MSYQLPTLRRWTNDEIKSRVGQEFKIRFSRGYLQDTLDMTIITNEEEEANEEEHHNKSVKAESKVEDKTRASKVKAHFSDGKAAIDLIITNSQGYQNRTGPVGSTGSAGNRTIVWSSSGNLANSRILAEVMTELEKLLPGAHALLKSVRKVVAKSTNDALIRDTSKKPRSKTLVLSQDLYESKGFLMEIDAIENILQVPEIRCVNSRNSLCLVSALGSLKKRNRCCL
ncbi:hypothetical protein Cgig2_011332 [Carnegiea gigantea]|uniref:Uncharacterized protein n=1 Tax=Carnegiea gigantea TaxID=171969 RepID=A0A9Q1KG51_9CARY|nr:hypothetical protein Cgig2_011332 [Carnegiea gigantea]